MNILVVVAFIAIFNGAQGCFAGDMDPESKKIAEACMTEKSVTIEMLKELKESGKEPDENVMCFSKCMLEGVGVVKDGSLEKETLRNKFGKQMGDKVEEYITKCDNQDGKDDCESYYKIFKCFAEVHEMFEE